MSIGKVALFPILSALVTTGCDVPLSSRQRTQVYTIAEDVAESRVTRGGDASVEERIAKLEREINSLKDRDKELLDLMVGQERAHNKLVDHYNRHLKVLHK